MFKKGELKYGWYCVTYRHKSTGKTWYDFRLLKVDKVSEYVENPENLICAVYGPYATREKVIEEECKREEKTGIPSARKDDPYPGTYLLDCGQDLERYIDNLHDIIYGFMLVTDPSSEHSEGSMKYLRNEVEELGLHDAKLFV